MIVKIIKSRDKLMWYVNLIGTKWNVVRQDNDCYYVRDNENKINIIYKNDTDIQLR